MIVSVPLAFAAGLLSFLSPCVLPLVPSYLAYVGGSGGLGRGVRLRNSLLFIAGFSLVFVAMGASASIVGATLRSYRSEMLFLGGLVVLLFGLAMLGLLRLPGFFRDTRLQFRGDATRPWGALLLGMAFAAGWTPCIGPMLGAILTAAGASDTLGQGVLLLAIYAAGLGLPFLLAALAVDAFMGFSRRLRGRLLLIERLGGALLVVVGVLMLSGYYTVLNSALVRITPDWLLSRL